MAVIAELTVLYMERTKKLIRQKLWRDRSECAFKCKPIPINPMLTEPDARKRVGFVTQRKTNKKYGKAEDFITFRQKKTRREYLHAVYLNKMHAMKTLHSITKLGSH